MENLSIVQKLEIEHTPEWMVIISNEPKVMGTALIDGLVRLISRKTSITKEQILQYLTVVKLEEKL